MRRRILLACLASPSLLWPWASWAEQPSPSRVAFIGGGVAETNKPVLDSLLTGLKEMGFVDGRNVVIEYRWAGGRSDRLPALIAELLQKRPDVLLATGGSAVALAAKAATSTTPIVFTTGGDPVGEGIVPSIARPGGNITGATFFNNTLAPKCVELLRDLLPQAKALGVLHNPAIPGAHEQLRDVLVAAHRAGFDPIVARASSAGEIDGAMTALLAGKPKALLLMASPIYNQHRQQIAERAISVKLPHCSAALDPVTAGALMGYGNSREAVFRWAGIYTGRILKGERPADLPVIQSTHFKLIINLKTAKALAIEVPMILLARADEVIE